MNASNVSEKDPHLMVQTPSKALTLENFLKLPETQPASEFIDGKIIQKPMPQGKHSRVQQKLITTVNEVMEVPRIALALPELRCTFGGRSIIPDIAVFLWDRIPTREDGDIADNFEAAPDWSIEILSPDQSVTRVTRNLLHCLDYGCQLGWLVDPLERLVIAYPPNQQPIYYEEPHHSLPVPSFAAQLQITVETLFGWLKVK
jgi:Uma2 family endonuclease